MRKDGEPLHGLTKKQIFEQATIFRNQGNLYNLQNPYCEDAFRGSIDRFCEIAHRLRYSRRVLDVGAGNSILASLLAELGHECYALDVADLPALAPEIYRRGKIHFLQCNVEVDKLPFPDNFFNAVVCCQVLEHFTHSHLKIMNEIYRVLTIGGIVEVDVPNAVCFHNRSRIIRGKNITWDYERHYLDTNPIIYRGLSFYPDRHNREFTRNELRLLLERGNFRNIDVYFLKSRRYRYGLERIKSFGSMLRDIIPSLRKSLIAFGEKV